MSLYSRLTKPGPSGFGYGSTAEEVTEGLDLTGRNVLVTGCNSGIGRETMRAMTLRGAKVLGAARTKQKAERACDAVEGNAVPVVCELSEPVSVRACAAKVQQLGVELHAIVCNAGIMALPRLEQQYGYEKQFFVNHVGHFILVTELLGQLADDGRVVVVASNAHRRGPREGIQFDNLSGEKDYAPWRAYGQSKFANILFAKELARRLEGTAKTANALHPGVIKTKLTRHMNPVLDFLYGLSEPLFLKSIPEGAATQTYVAVHPDAAGVSGEYFSHCNISRARKLADNTGMAKRLWEETERIVDELDG